MNKVEDLPLKAAGEVAMGGDDSAHDADRWRWCVENDAWPTPSPPWLSKEVKYSWAVYYGGDRDLAAYGFTPAEAVDRARGVL